MRHLSNPNASVLPTLRNFFQTRHRLFHFLYNSKFHLRNVFIGLSCRIYLKSSRFSFSFCFLLRIQRLFILRSRGGDFSYYLGVLILEKIFLGIVRDSDCVDSLFPDDLPEGTFFNRYTVWTGLWTLQLHYKSQLLSSFY